MPPQQIRNNQRQFWSEGVYSLDNHPQRHILQPGLQPIRDVPDVNTEEQRKTQRLPGGFFQSDTNTVAGMCSPFRDVFTLATDPVAVVGTMLVSALGLAALAVPYMF